MTDINWTVIRPITKFEILKCGNLSSEEFVEKFKELDANTPNCNLFLPLNKNHFYIYTSYWNDFLIKHKFITITKELQFDTLDKLQIFGLEGWWTIVGNTRSRESVRNINLVCFDDCEWYGVYYSSKFVSVHSGYNIAKTFIEESFNIRIAKCKRYHGKRYEN